ncbi:MAG: GTP-binding protein TypA [Candidatus Levybacteria bacterium RIFOXYA1_FULL_41_10]|nr:MAG: GTP-binding protein TypA/BipA [Candidatus Levybacteria bacterium GW2011_GWA2_41_15]OGH27410.1 MAG: GTP-binding protein TypA [Candidatus Levybacteria bacterium RIFCSPHIGHO2_02_FULL_40_29]OGH50048.1 MAG: GTP-binding protein TypA [Candidatus Levybacteria bacterium RIFCSPLOWO2_02_FULL_40_18]OGH54963.1 MAG: GTP-binding protein TypA [Candidatus Levybacteria bacterium RIFOXYD1_FULL_40_21]OGH55163.1 MAG: GTP-binding protein TypA [Candidatus Levybacteria bacterium RIFOXYC1_FULL_40_10]OGH56840.1
MNDIRNVAIIAHVDHGKTTLVDALLKQSKTKMHKDTADSLIMDTNELEQERGITIFSKNASVVWNDVKINIIDTPGHADFGGEVERVLKMADGCLLLIDAKEGPMPQTRFVLKKALEMKLKIIVVVNKIDKSDARIHHALDKTLDLFLDLGADDQSADFPIVYASAKQGVAGLGDDLSQMTDITPIFETILKEIPAPQKDNSGTLQFLVTTLSSDNHKGRIAIGRIYKGTIKKNQEVSQIKRDGEILRHKVVSLMTFVGLERVEVDEVKAGDLAAIAGIPEPTIGETISDSLNPEALPLIAIEEPTIRATFMVNSSPFAGKEGEYKTSRQIRDRLYKELETDMALRVEDNDSGWIVSGRGELHLAILIERMRREGYEFQVGRPQVIDRAIDGKTLTPYEKVYLEAPVEFSGAVIQKMGGRRAEMKDMASENGIVYMEFIISTKNLFGYRSEFVTDTKGLGIMNTLFFEYAEDPGFSIQREQGSLISHETGVTNTYSLTNIQDRGTLFIGPEIKVYKGQVIGRSSRNDDMRVNACKTKQLTNHRSKGEGVSVYFKTPKTMALEDALEYIADDELVEVTPKSVRIRKVILDEIEARRQRAQGLSL